MIAAHRREPPRWGCWPRCEGRCARRKMGWPTGALRWLSKRYGWSHIAMRPGPGWCNKSSARRLQTPSHVVGWSSGARAAACGFGRRNVDL